MTKLASEQVELQTTMRGSNQSGMRAHNERLVLSLIRRQGPMSKSEIARLSGLSAQTVSVIMRALESDRLLEKCDPIRGKVGQPLVPMRLARGGAYFLGLKVGRRSIELVLTDFTGAVLDRALRTHSHPMPAATVEFACEKIEALTARLTPEQRRRIAGLGIAIPFFLWDWAKSLGVPEKEMDAWRTADIRADIAARHSFPVFLENDASTACAAEVAFGAADAPRDFLYFYVGYFIGGGVVLNGALFTGRGNSGALGPMPVPGTDGRIRQLIEVASLSVLEARLQTTGAETSELWSQADAWNVDDAILGDWIDFAAAGLAHAVVAACAIIDFEAVLIDGWIPLDVRSALVAGVDRHLDTHNLTGLRRPEIRSGTVGANARTLGAASLPLSERFLLDQTAILIGA